MKPFILLRPATLSEAAREAARPGSEVKAGGVDLLDRMKEGFDSPQRVVSIAHVPGLDVISAGPPAKIGALATLARIASSSDIKRLYPALAAAAEGAATPQIRNMATLGGNLCQRPRCWYYRLAEFDCRKKGGPTSSLCWPTARSSTRSRPGAGGRSCSTTSSCGRPRTPGARMS